MGWIRRRLVPGALAAAAVLAGPACGGHVTAPAPAASPSSRPVMSRAPWPERGIVLAEARDARLAFASQVLDPAAGVLYALVPTTLTSPSAPEVLQAIDLRTGRVRRGGSYQAYGLALASGLLWVSGYSGPGGHPVLDVVSPGTLATVRSVSMPGPSSLAWVTAGGPAGSVWAGAGRTLLRVSVSTGAVLARAALPAGLDLTALAAGPGGEDMYAAAARLRPPYGAVVLGYSAGAGRLLAQTGGATLKWSAGGASLTAVPGGVWVSFRTGMLGQSGLLSARSLSPVSGFPAAFSPADSPATGGGTVYGWAMASDSAYGGGALWVATSGGLVACVNPATGQVRAEEMVTSRQGTAFYAVAADRAAGRLVAVASTTADTGVMTITVLTITPPRDCWG